MLIEVTVDTRRVAEIRKVLDPYSCVPPTVGKNEATPNTTYLYYSGVVDSDRFAYVAAQQHGVSNVIRYRRG